MWPWLVFLWPTQALTRYVWRSALEVSGSQADEVAIAITRNPEALLEALEHLQHDRQQLGPAPPETIPLWLEPDGVTSLEPIPFTRPALVCQLEHRIRHLADICGRSPRLG
jgi:hypothetical protein